MTGKPDNRVQALHWIPVCPPGQRYSSGQAEGQSGQVAGQPCRSSRMGKGKASYKTGQGQTVQPEGGPYQRHRRNSDLDHHARRKSDRVGQDQVNRPARKQAGKNPRSATPAFQAPGTMIGRLHFDFRISRLHIDNPALLPD